MSFSNYAADLATKGWLSDSRQLVVKGWLVAITVEEIPTQPTSGGGIVLIPGEEIPRKVPKGKKLIKITVEYNNQTFTEIKEVKDNLNVTAKDIEIEIGDNQKPTIKVRVID